MPEITAMLATIPEREAFFTRVVQDLLPQVDSVRAYLNGHEKPPEICKHPRVRWHGTCAGGPDLGDGGKFAFEADGYVLTVDDDLFYPPDYVETMIAGVDRYGVVTMHGKRFEFPVDSYYRGISENYRCLGHVAADVRVDVPGTGVMAYHTNVILFDAFPEPNMADIWVALACREAGVPITCLAHEGGWIRHQPIDASTTIFWRYHKRDARQTQLVNRLMQI